MKLHHDCEEKLLEASNIILNLRRNIDKLESELTEANLKIQQLEEKSSTIIKRTVDAAYCALLEMSAWLGIPDKKRADYIEDQMSNIRFCAQNDLREQDNQQVKNHIQQLESENEVLKAKLGKAVEQRNNAIERFYATIEPSSAERRRLATDQKKDKYNYELNATTKETIK